MASCYLLCGKHFTLGTHDVQRTDMENSTINVSYVENTRAKGALCILISVRDGRVDFDSSVFVFIRSNEEMPIAMPLYLRPGKYDVACYDVESNGRLPPGVGYPAYVQRISITQTGKKKSFHPSLILFTSKMYMQGQFSSLDHFILKTVV